MSRWCPCVTDQISNLELFHEKQNPDFGGTRALTAFVGFSHLCFGPGAQASALQRPDQRLLPLSASVKGSPWEMHGQWSMDVHPEWGTADFSADMTMSGFGKTAAGAVDPTQPLVNPHTHHIQLTNVKITWDMTGCPAYATPRHHNGLSVKRHGQPVDREWKIAPFETNPPSSTLQVCVTGGDEGQFSVPNSNITLVFGGPAANNILGRRPSMASCVCANRAVRDISISRP